MTGVDIAMSVAAVLLLAGVIGLGLWAIRRQSRMFPKDFDRTGWDPDGERAGSFITKFFGLPPRSGD